MIDVLSNSCFSESHDEMDLRHRLYIGIKDLKQLPMPGIF